jgi:hypothetical protein
MSFMLRSTKSGSLDICVGYLVYQLALYKGRAPQLDAHFFGHVGDCGHNEALHAPLRPAQISQRRYMHQKVQSHTAAVRTQKTHIYSSSRAAAAARVYLHQRVQNHTAVRQVVVSCEDIPLLQPQHNAVFCQGLTCSAKQVHWKPRKIQYLVVLERWSHCCMVNTDRPALVTTEATVIIRNTCCLHHTQQNSV